MHWACRVRRHHFGNAVKLCSIVAGKLGACSEDCKWCAQSGSRLGCEADQSKRTSMDDISAAAGEAAAVGAGSFGIVNSGRRPAERDLIEVEKAAERIRCELGCGIRLCASVGELTVQQAGRLKAAGVSRYNHNLETSRRMYGRMVSTHGYEDRLRTLAAVREAGLSLCCGGIFGLGETWADRVEMALTLRDQVRPDVVPLNFLHPIPGTALQDVEPPAPMEILTIIAVFRMVLPTVDLKIAGGREANLRDLQSWMFYAGATSCLIGNYLTTCGRPADDDLCMIADLGLNVVAELPAAAASR
ncbi:MAG: biotin synthase BioB [Planctomycetota bacterium]|nr:biotin synthase BioB [Planctomycetota bacterium]